MERKEKPETVPFHRDTTGVILAGGKSRRLGRDKALLVIDGMTLFQRMLDVLDGRFPEILVSGSRADLAGDRFRVVKDFHPGSALGGLYSALHVARTPYVFVAACDMPFPDPELMERLLAMRMGQDVVVVKTPLGYEPLYAVYGKGCLAPMAEMLELGDYRIRKLFSRVKTRRVAPEELAPNWQKAFTNINTPEDHERVETFLSEGRTSGKRTAG